MKLVAVTVVKNEADIIEAFVRHTRVWADHHVILDANSTDGTRQILAALVREGLPLTLLTGDAGDHRARLGSNDLTRMAFDVQAADWVLPLNADEFLTGADRVGLERLLAERGASGPMTIPIQNYSPTTADDVAVRNPALRIQYRQHGTSGTSRIVIPLALGTRPDVEADVGNHGLFAGNSRLESPELPGLSLARFALRTPQQQVRHVVMGELQRLGRGRSAAGLDTHNRLGFQLLAEDPESFFATVLQPPGKLVHAPITYRGGAIQHDDGATEIIRSARALLPYLEALAASHGRLVDQLNELARPPSALAPVRILAPSEVPELADRSRDPFTGFVALSGWQKQEGPAPSAFLPVFHWGTAPETVLRVDAAIAHEARLHADVLTYAERQVVTVVLNGIELIRHVFTQVNQKETIALPLKLDAGENRLVFRHRAWLHSAADPRKLALIFLSVRVQPS